MKKLRNLWFVICSMLLVGMLALTIGKEQVQAESGSYVTTFGNYVVYYEDVTGGVEITGGDPIEGSSAWRIIIPGSIDGKTVVGIGDNAFNGEFQEVPNSSRRYSLVIPSVRYIGENAFLNCKIDEFELDCDNLQEVRGGLKGTFNKISITTNYSRGGGNIPAGMFPATCWVEEISIYQKYTNEYGEITIASNAFAGTKPDSLEIISENIRIMPNAFQQVKIDTMDISGQGLVIEDEAFTGESSGDACDIGELNISGKNITIGDRAFSYCDFDNVTLEGEINLGEGIFEESAVAKLVVGVPTISKGSFSNMATIKSLELLDGVTSIGESAFENSIIHGEVKIPEGVTRIENNAFRMTKWFGDDDYLEIPQSVTYIGDGAFSSCPNFTGELVIPQGVTYIGDSAFSGCGGFTGELVIPQGITYIGDDTFSGCSGFTGELVIPQGVTYIGDSAFWGCSGFTGELVIPQGVTYIGDSAFWSCSGFTGKLEIPQGVTYIGDGAFAHCKAFTGELEIPQGVTYIGGSAFAHCNGFTGDLILPEGIGRIGSSAFYMCEGFDGNLVLPQGVTYIGDSAFYLCGGFTGDLILPGSVTYVGKEAFYGIDYSNDRVVIPKNLSSIPEILFTGRAAEVVFEGNPPENYEQLAWDGKTIYYPFYIDAWEDEIKKIKEDPDNSLNNREWIPYYTSAARFVQRMYTVALDREADEAGCEWWFLELLNDNSDGAGLAQGFLIGDEFKNKGYSNEEYVAVLYDTFFNREVAEGEGDFWVECLEDGVSRESVLAGFVNSDEFYNLCEEYGISRGCMLESGVAINSGISQFTKRLYTEVLGRTGDAEGMEYWARSIVNGDCKPKDAANNFFTSAEYQARRDDDVEYLWALYKTFMGREPDDGAMFWLEALQNGVADRESVLNSFADSAEFQAIMASYGLQ